MILSMLIILASVGGMFTLRKILFSSSDAGRGIIAGLVVMGSTQRSYDGSAGTGVQPCRRSRARDR